MATRPPEHSDVHFEHSDINSPHTLLVGICVLLGLWIFTGLLYFYYSALAHYREHVSPPVLPIEAHGYVVPPSPRLQQSPRLDMKEMNRYEDWELGHYHWLNQQQGIVAIPIDRAIDIVASRGIPPTAGAANPSNTPPQDGTRETGFRGKVEPEPR